MHNTYNELVYALSLRARELADLPLPQLRRLHPDVVGTGSNYEAEQATLGCTRGNIIEVILTEEFVLDFDKDIEQ